MRRVGVVALVGCAYLSLGFVGGEQEGRAGWVSVQSRVNPTQEASEPDRALFLHGGASRAYDPFARPDGVPGEVQAAFQALPFSLSTDAAVSVLVMDDGCEGPHGAALVRAVRVLAPAAGVECVSVFDPASGTGTLSAVRRAFLRLTTSSTRALRTVVLLAGGTVGPSPVLDLLIGDAVQLGEALVVVSAGNAGADACGHSPGRAKYAFTVGALGPGRADSNHGPCVAFRAPGQSTSRAAAVAAAFAARVWTAHPDMYPVELHHFLKRVGQIATPGEPDGFTYVPPGAELWVVAGQEPRAGVHAPPPELGVRVRRVEGCATWLVETDRGAARTVSLHSAGPELDGEPGHTRTVDPASSASLQADELELAVADTHVVMRHARNLETRWTRAVGRPLRIGLRGPCAYFRLAEAEPRRVLEEEKAEQGCPPPRFMYAGRCRAAGFCEFAQRTLCARRGEQCAWVSGECVARHGSMDMA